MIEKIEDQTYRRENIKKHFEENGNNTNRLKYKHTRTKNMSKEELCCCLSETVSDRETEEIRTKPPEGAKISANRPN